MLASSVFASAAILASNWQQINKNYESENLYKKIILKEKNILKLMKSNFGYTLDVPIVITNELDKNVYGITVCAQDGTIKIFLNETVMQNNINYVVNTVLPHEYAHALMFNQKLLAKNKDGYALRVEENKFSNKHKNDGHNHTWKKTCKKLGGDKCQSFATYKDTQMSKLF